MSSGTTKFHMPQPIAKTEVQKEHQSATVGSTTGGGSTPISVGGPGSSGSSSGGGANVVKVYQNQLQYIVTSKSGNSGLRTGSPVDSSNGTVLVKSSETYVSSSSTTAEAMTTTDTATGNGNVTVEFKQANSTAGGGGGDNTSSTDQEASSIEQQEQSIIAALYQQQSSLSKNGSSRLTTTAVAASQRSASPVSSPSPPAGQVVVAAASSHTRLSNGSSSAAGMVKMSAPTVVTTASSGGASNTANFHNFIGRLISKDNMLLISEDIIEVGRNSSKSQVDFHVGKNSFVSRKHFIIQHDMNDDFNLFCLSKNGVFIDNVFHRKCAEPYKLPKVCSIRFPSTNIKIQFENLIDQANNGGISIDLNQHTPIKVGTGSGGGGNAAAIAAVGGTGLGTIMGGASDDKSTGASPKVVYTPLKISIPEQAGGGGAAGGHQGGSDVRGGHHPGGGGGGGGGAGAGMHVSGSGYPSPTGTISAANSCPTSPRQNTHEFPQYSHNSHSSNNNNYSEFQAPASQAMSDSDKPPYSYAQLIVQAISASPEKQLTLSGIYSFISKNYPYYRTGANKGWQNSIRHNLSLNRYFIKVPRSQDEPGKGSFWRIDPSSEVKLIDQSYRKRRQRGSQCFRSPFGMPRSAPVSPSYMDANSREGSPVGDELLLSAPGSPGQSNTPGGGSNNASYSSNHDGSQQHTSYQHQYNTYASGGSGSGGGDHHSNDVYEDDDQVEYDSDEYESAPTPIKRQKI